MLRRILCVLLGLTLMLPGYALAGGPEIPSREIFSLAYSRFETALRAGQQVNWGVTIEPSAVQNLEGGALEAYIAMFGALELHGVVQTLQEGGYMSAALASGGQEVASVAQMISEGRTALSFGGEWISTPVGTEAEAAASLQLDEMGKAMFTMDYSSLRAGDIPFLTPVYNAGIRLWQLASPYSYDNNRLRVPSGSTSHGTSYEIDTYAFRGILKEWADELTVGGLSLGLAGTDIHLGVSEEAFAAFVEKVRAFAGTVELYKPLQFNLAFGEEDILRTAKGSGTLQEGNKRTAVSYSYSYSQSSTRVTRKYSLDFQPKEADTLVLSCTWLTSSNNSKSGAQEITINASGVYNGQPYRVKVSSEMVNKYALGENGALTEVITGTMTGSITYAGETVLDITIKRNGEMASGANQRAVTIVDAFDTTLKNEQGTLFEGTITLSLTLEEEPAKMPSMETARRLEDMDMLEVELVRDEMSEAMLAAKRNLIRVLSVSAIKALKGVQ